MKAIETIKAEYIFKLKNELNSIYKFESEYIAEELKIDVFKVKDNILDVAKKVTVEFGEELDNGRLKKYSPNEKDTVFDEFGKELKEILRIKIHHFMSQ